MGQSYICNSKIINSIRKMDQAHSDKVDDVRCTVHTVNVVHFIILLIVLWRLKMLMAFVIAQFTFYWTFTLVLILSLPMIALTAIAYWINLNQCANNNDLLLFHTIRSILGLCICVPFACKHLNKLCSEDVFFLLSVDRSMFCWINIKQVQVFHINR